MNILVTGGAGYIGSVLVPELLKDGHEVTVLDNFLYRQSPLNHLCSNAFFDVERGDCRDASTMERLLERCDVLIPLAAIVGAPACDADLCAAKSTNSGAVWMANTIMSRDQRIIIPITNSGYGIGQPGVECTEDTPLRPISVYGQTKVDAEKALLGRDNAISLRLATVFGMSPRMRLDLLVNDFVYRAVTDRALVLYEARFRRNYIHVRDVAAAFLHALDNFDAMKGKPYNVGLSDENLSKLDLCKRIKAHVPGFYFTEAPIGKDPDQRDYVVSNARIEATGFHPAFTLDDGINELIKGYRMLRGSAYGNV